MESIRRAQNRFRSGVSNQDDHLPDIRVKNSTVGAEDDQNPINIDVNNSMTNQADDVAVQYVNNSFATQHVTRKQSAVFSANDFSVDLSGLKQQPSFSLLKTKEELAVIKANEIKTKNRVNYLSKEHSRLQQKVSQMQKVMDTRANILESKNKDKEMLMKNKEFRQQLEEQKALQTQSVKKLAELRH